MRDTSVPRAKSVRSIARADCAAAVAVLMPPAEYRARPHKQAADGKPAGRYGDGRGPLVAHVQSPTLERAPAIGAGSRFPTRLPKRSGDSVVPNCARFFVCAAPQSGIYLNWAARKSSQLACETRKEQAF